jgi:alkylation response protein AidB-like acyl-CoA dehydrogenase
MELAGVQALAWGAEEGGKVGTRYLNGRVYSIAGGTNEMQRNAIAERVHGLPRV